MKHASAVLALTIAALTVSGCADKPNDTVIESELREELTKSIPERWMKAMVTGGNAQIDSVEILEFGDFNHAGGYWPVRVEVSGSATLNVPFGPRETRDFREVAEMRLRKDDYGEWQGVLVRPALFGN